MMPGRFGDHTPKCANTGLSRTTIDRLRFDYITDIMLALSFAKWAGYDCVIYLPIGEELATAPGPYTARWRRFADILEQLVRHIVAEIAGPGPPSR